MLPSKWCCLCSSTGSLIKEHKGRTWWSSVAKSAISQLEHKLHRMQETSPYTPSVYLFFSCMHACTAHTSRLARTRETNNQSWHTVVISPASPWVARSNRFLSGAHKLISQFEMPKVSHSEFSTTSCWVWEFYQSKNLGSPRFEASINLVWVSGEMAVIYIYIYHTWSMIPKTIPVSTRFFQTRNGSSWRVSWG